MSCEVPNVFALSEMHGYARTHTRAQLPREVGDLGYEKKHTNTVKMPPLYSK